MSASIQLHKSQHLCKTQKTEDKKDTYTNHYENNLIIGPKKESKILRKVQVPRNYHYEAAQF